MDRALRYGHRCCAAFCDIDLFKSYNDAYGHLRPVSAQNIRGHRDLCGLGSVRATRTCADLMVQMMKVRSNSCSMRTLC